MSSLTPVEREAITDSILKIQSVKASLEFVEERKVPNMGEIQECLTQTHNNLRQALTTSGTKPGLRDPS